MALVPTGQLQLKHQRYAHDFEPVDQTCTCSTCAHYTRAYLHTIVTREPAACSMLTIHNVAYQVCTAVMLLSTRALASLVSLRFNRKSDMDSAAMNSK